MRYEDHLNFFEKEISELGKSPMNLSFPIIMEALGNDGFNETDEAIRHFINTFCWPNVSDRVRFELCLRLSCAKWYCKENGEMDTEDETGKEFLESLLIEYWRDVGRVDWIHSHFVESFYDETRKSWMSPEEFNEKYNS